MLLSAVQIPIHYPAVFLEPRSFSHRWECGCSRPLNFLVNGNINITQLRRDIGPKDGQKIWVVGEFLGRESFSSAGESIDKPWSKIRSR